MLAANCKQPPADPDEETAMTQIDIAPRQVIFAPELVVRDSTGPAPGAARRSRKATPTEV